MTVLNNRAEYAKRMHRALEYIDRNLDRRLELSELAEVAHFSAFHFHRVFAAWLGETFGEYVRRRRLEAAASRLTGQPRLPVLSVALSVGFGYTEAFCRAFKTRFGCTPTAWRKQEANARSAGASAHDQATLNRNPDQLKSSPNQAVQAKYLQNPVTNQFPPEIPMKVTVIDRQPVKVAYLRHVGPYGDSLSQFWQNAVYPWMVSNNLLGRVRYGVCHDDPAVTSPEKCRYDAAVEVEGALKAPGEALLTTLPGGRYGLAPFRGTSGQIGMAWNRLLRDWLPSSGLQLDGRPFFEYYTTEATFEAKRGIFTCDLAVPVAPL